MTDLTKKLLERYESRRAARSINEAAAPDEAAALDPQLRSYRRAAAVLHSFAPDSLRPLDPEYQHSRPRVLLFDEITVAAGERAEGIFMLKPEVKRQTLREFSSREEMREALRANPDRRLTPLQKMWEGYLATGSVPRPETLGYGQLTNLCQMLSWLGDSDKELPDLEYVMGLARRKSVLASFEHLVISNFTGRAKELDMLREHVGVLPPASGIQAVRRQFSDWLKAPRKPILAIYGPGGIGKSALIGRMLWEHTLADSRTRFPFAYLAFDQPTLRVDSPFTLLVESAAQFDLQFPEHSVSIRRFNDAVRKFRDDRGALGERRKVVATRGERLGELHGLERELYVDFAVLLATIGNKDAIYSPVLLALDTFEEVQYRDRESLAGFWRMLDIIQEAYPPFRVIISGRAPVAELGVEKRRLDEKRLAELAMEDRISLLMSLGVSDPSMAQAVAEQVGGNPLSLRMASNVITSDAQAATSKGIKDLNTRSWIFLQLEDEIIQGQLYRRILDHIHDENVRKLAHPGMVLRRVSPEVILKVLAPLCQIPIGRLDEAERLFDELRREQALVQTGIEGTLVYRPEIRKAMVRMLEQDKFCEVRELHRAAISYYKDKEGVGARAEEIYHRLALGEDEFWELDLRWMDGIDQSIAASLDEYPDRVKAWLASRMNLEVPRSVFQGASVADWERNITRKVQRALSELQTERALSLLGERQERSDASPLFALEAKTHLLRNDLDGAWEVLEKGVERVSRSTNRGRLGELFWLQSQVALMRGDPKFADQLLERAGQAVEKGRNPLPLLHVLCHRLLLRDHFQAASPESTAILRARLNSACKRIDETIAFSSPFVVGFALSMLRNEFPKTTERLTKLVQYVFPPPLDTLTSENLQGLEEYREPWEEETNPSAEATV